MHPRRSSRPRANARNPVPRIPVGDERAQKRVLGVPCEGSEADWMVGVTGAELRAEGWDEITWGGAFGGVCVYVRACV